MQSTSSATVACVGVLSIVVGLAMVSAQGSRDHEFVLQAAMSNMAEIQFGHMATEKGQDASVKKFAQMMVDDHVKAQQQLADAAYGAGIKWPKQLDERHRQIQKRLSNLSAAQFDREYMKAMVDGHREVDQLLASRATNGGESVRTSASGGEPSLAVKVSQWAAKTLPNVRTHLEQAEQLYSGLAK